MFDKKSNSVLSISKIDDEVVSEFESACSFLCSVVFFITYLVLFLLRMQLTFAKIPV